jgi:hypothetical protein
VSAGEPLRPQQKAASAIAISSTKLSSAKPNQLASTSTFVNYYYKGCLGFFHLRHVDPTVPEPDPVSGHGAAYYHWKGHHQLEDLEQADWDDPIFLVFKVEDHPFPLYWAFARHAGPWGCYAVWWGFLTTNNTVEWHFYGAPMANVRAVAENGLK